MLPEVMEVVAGRLFPARLARLHGHRRLALAGAVYPALVPAAGATTEGVLWEGLDAAALARVDRFEGAPYERALVEVELESGEPREAFVYRLGQGQLALASDAPWDAAEFRARHLAAFLAACRAFARHEP